MNWKIVLIDGTELIFEQEKKTLYPLCIWCPQTGWEETFGHRNNPERRYFFHSVLYYEPFNE